MSRRLLVVAFEMGDAESFRRFAEAGHMPLFAELLGRGGARHLATPARELHVSALPSLYTGAGPGEHGVYFTFQPAPGERGWVRFHEGLYGVPTVWKRLADAGVRTVAFDPPYAHPEPGFSGLAVFDWGTWAKYLGPRSLPPSLLRELESAVGRHPLPWEAHDLGLSPLDPATVEEALARALRARRDAALWLLREHAWDVAFVVFDETHVAGHYLFDPAGDDARLRRFCAALDAAVGELWEALGRDGVDLVLVSGDGIGPNHAGWHLLPEVMARFGWYASAEFTAGQATEGRPAARPGFDPVRALRDLLPGDLRKSLARMLPRTLRDRLARRVDTAAVDWARTRAYPLPTDLEGLIRVNLAGREPDGTVAPGRGCEALLDEMEEALRGLVCAETGRKVVREVVRVDACFPGRRRDHLPDLVVLWDDRAPIRAVRHPAIGEVRGESPDPRPGTHAPRAFALASTGGAGEGGSVLDLAPTLLARFGLPRPAELKGGIWDELVSGGRH